MNCIKSFGLVGVAATALFAAQAFAAPTCANAPATGTPTQGSPVCIAPVGVDGPGTGLQDVLNGITKPGTSQIDVYNDQHHPSAYWQAGATGGSVNTIVFEIAGDAAINAFGIYDPTNTSNMLQLFSGPDGAGTRSTLVDYGSGHFAAATFGGPAVDANFGGGATFGYYLDTKYGIFYSDPSQNSDGMAHMLAYQGNGTTQLNSGPGYRLFLPNEFLLAWEDQLWDHSDMDYNDFVVLVESVRPVPEPAALGMFGLGVLMIGGIAALRRRRSFNA